MYNLQNCHATLRSASHRPSIHESWHKSMHLPATYAEMCTMRNRSHECARLPQKGRGRRARAMCGRMICVICCEHISIHAFSRRWWWVRGGRMCIPFRFAIKEHSSVRWLKDLWNLALPEQLDGSCERACLCGNSMRCMRVCVCGNMCMHVFGLKGLSWRAHIFVFQRV